MIDVTQLTAADIMQSPVHCASPDDRLCDLEESLFEKQISGMPVVENGELVGVVSRSEFVRVPLLMEDWKAYARDELTRDGAAWVDPEESPPEGSMFPKSGGLADEIRVRHVMPSQVLTCAPQTPVAQVAADMVEHHVHRIIVVENDGPVGVVSSIDLIRLLVD